MDDDKRVFISIRGLFEFGNTVSDPASKRLKNATFVVLAVVKGILRQFV